MRFKNDKNKFLGTARNSNKIIIPVSDLFLNRRLENQQKNSKTRPKS